jgi:hypothetical protein
LFRKSQDLLAARFSGTKNLDQILWRSWNALAESEDSAAFASLGLFAKRCGTGPLATSLSNIVVRRGHSAARTVGTVSLGGKWLILILVMNFPVSQVAIEDFSGCMP